MNAFISQAQAQSPVVGTAVGAASNSPSATAPVAEKQLDVLARYWQKEKAAEVHARERRLNIEQQIMHLVGVAEEGTTNAEGNLFKVKTVGKLTRTLDDKAIQTDWDKLPAEIKQCFKWKPSLDTKNLRALESMREDLIPVMASYLTTKPAKPSVTVEVK